MSADVPGRALREIGPCLVVEEFQRGDQGGGVRQGRLPVGRIAGDGEAARYDRSRRASPEGRP
ncbi:MAG TPA: hypothetical protein DD420_01340 [Streptomyces sp.]|nr:hypothetical protein [Streptomyces sp.]